MGFCRPCRSDDTVREIRQCSCKCSAPWGWIERGSDHITYPSIYSSISLLAALGSRVKVEGAASTLMSSYRASLEVWWLMTTVILLVLLLFFYTGNHGNDEWATVQRPNWPMNICSKGLVILTISMWNITNSGCVHVHMTYTTCIKQQGSPTKIMMCALQLLWHNETFARVSYVSVPMYECEYVYMYVQL